MPYTYSPIYNPKPLFQKNRQVKEGYTHHDPSQKDGVYITESTLTLMLLVILVLLCTAIYKTVAEMKETMVALAKKIGEAANISTTA